MSSGCLFCGIVAGEVSADVVADNAHAVAFRDLNPQAPTHVLVVPRAHYDDAAALAGGDADALAGVLALAAQVAAAEGLDGYRAVFNNGASAGQTVFHAHLHVLGGRALQWPPG